MVEKESIPIFLTNGQVTCDSNILDEYSQDISFVNHIRPRCITSPSNAAGVQQIIRYANDTGIPLVPISSGPPHFRGDTVPGIGGAVVVDLRRMNRIINVDRPRRVAMVEAGVTFDELIPAVEKEKLRLNLPLLPRKNKSVVASMLEREPVIMPAYQWDISDPIACIEVIFGNGEEFRTGQAAGPGTVEEQWEAGAVQKAPYGPGTASLHRLIQGAQGTMGIVTWASLRCELRPQLEEPFLVGSASLSRLLELCHWLIRLRLVNECFIVNNVNLASIMADKQFAGREKLKHLLPPWILFYNIAGYDYFPEDRVSYRVKNISEIAQRIGVEPVNAIGTVSATTLLETIKLPSSEPYWKLRNEGACEDIFFLTINDKLEELIRTMKDTSDESGFPTSDIGIYLQPVVQGTGCHCEFNLFYDPDNSWKSNQVKELSTKATKALLSQGAFFSRPYGENANLIINRDAASVTLLSRLKKIFDPNNVMNPGKLCF